MDIRFKIPQFLGLPTNFLASSYPCEYLPSASCILGARDRPFARLVYIIEAEPIARAFDSPEYCLGIYRIPHYS
jgi:hypothetical protein